MRDDARAPFRISYAQDPGSQAYTVASVCVHSAALPLTNAWTLRYCGATDAQHAHVIVVGLGEFATEIVAALAHDDQRPRQDRKQRRLRILRRLSPGNR
jgi:hypothetical protein